MTEQQEIEHAFLIRDLVIALYSLRSSSFFDDCVIGLPGADAHWTALWFIGILASNIMPSLSNNSMVMRVLKEDYPELLVRTQVFMSTLKDE